MVIACFISQVIEMFPILGTPSILLIQPSRKGKFEKLSLSVLRFHKGSFLKKCIKIIFRFDDVDSIALHLFIEIIGGIVNISHVRQNDNEIGIFDAICVTMLVLIQKQG